MGKLCMMLPPFSPDYSGVCSALFPFDALTVIHDASGCTGNYTGYDEPRWFHSRKPIYCSGLREMDAILGDDEKLIQKILYALEDVRPELIALVGSPVPMVIGTDMEGIAAEVEQRTGIMTVGFPTTGLNYYPKGIEMVYQKVIQRILQEDTKDAEKQENVVNILGATPLDFGESHTIEELQRFLNENGFKVHTALWKDVSRSEVEGLKNAACNIVVSNAGISLAEYMKKMYHIPYITGLPFGKKYAEIWLEELNACIQGKEYGLKHFEEGTHEKRILIIGEQLQANSIRNAFRTRYRVNCDVAGICGWDDRFAEENDKYMESEATIAHMMNEEQYDAIIGDAMYQGLLNKDKNFYEYSHYAVSSKLGTTTCPSLIQYSEKNIAFLYDL